MVVEVLEVTETVEVFLRRLLLLKKFPNVTCK